MLLNVHSYYSLRYGTIPPGQLFELLKSRGYTDFVLTDINNVSALIYHIRDARANGMVPKAGIDFRNGILQCYVGIARNNEGMKELNSHLSMHLCSGIPYSGQAPVFLQAYIIYPLQAYKGWPLRQNEYIGVSTADLSKLHYTKNVSPDRLVLLQTATFSNKVEYNMHRLLRAIDCNSLLSMLPKSEQALQHQIITNANDLLASFASYPRAVANTRRLLADCEVGVDFGKYAAKTRQHFTRSVSEDQELLRSYCLQAVPYRYPVSEPIVRQRLEKELGVIAQMNFASYYLINHDIINYARHKGYYHIGRGSGANSMVAYLLGITDVDPIELNLYFERFINPHRSTPPDFDIDFNWTDRDDVTRYIFDTHGEGGRVALLGAYNTFQYKAVIRELGKVMGLPVSEIEKLQKNPSRINDDVSRQLLRYSSRLHDFPSHLSIHSSGVIIADKPVTTYTATFMPPKGLPTTHFSMLEAEDIGLFKFDILSQRGLGKIKDTLTIVKKNHGVDVDIHNVKAFYTDENVKNLLRQGQTIGCFYVESPAMRMLLCKLQADDYLRLVAASSIIRPGVAKSGMMREYIERYHDEVLREKARHEQPELYAILEETYGVMVYQEDVIRVAHEFAGLSLDDADYLRRGMNWKYQKGDEFKQVKQRFFYNCQVQGHAQALIDKVWMQVESFANFAFAKGHSASYAVESYQALYLKAYYPLEYMVATLNNGGGYYRPEIYVHEARMQGAVIHTPCVNNSGIETRIEGNHIYLGFGMINTLSESIVALILQERNRGGTFVSLPDFVNRVKIELKQLEQLIKSGAFYFTGKTKKSMLWECNIIFTDKALHKITAQTTALKLPAITVPSISQSHIDDFYDQFEAMGFPVVSPFSILPDVPAPISASQFPHLVGQQVSITGYLAAKKVVRTSAGKEMCFATFIDSSGHWIDTILFPEAFSNSSGFYPGCYLLSGTVIAEHGFISLNISHTQQYGRQNQMDVVPEITEI